MATPSGESFAGGAACAAGVVRKSRIPKARAAETTIEVSGRRESMAGASDLRVIQCHTQRASVPGGTGGFRREGGVVRSLSSPLTSYSEPQQSSSTPVLAGKSQVT